MNIGKITETVKSGFSLAKRLVTEHPYILASGVAVATAEAFVFAPWIAGPICGYTVWASLSISLYQEEKKWLDETKPEGEIWQRPYKRHLGMSRMYMVAAAAFAALPAYFYNAANSLDDRTQEIIWERVNVMDRAGRLQRGVPFEIDVDKNNIRLVIAPREYGMPAGTYDADITYMSPSALRNHGPVRRQGYYSLDDPSTQVGTFGRPPPPLPR